VGTISLKNISKSFGSTQVLNNLNVDINDGEFLTLVGPSGCGKSTLLRIIAGLEQQTSGDVLIDNKNVNRVRASERDLAMVFQSYALYPHLTVRRNLETPLRLRDYNAFERLPLIGNFSPSKKDKTESINQLVNKTSETLKISELLDRKPGQLSGGQRQRVALGRAMVREPVAFLMDEPLSNLDAALRVHMRSELSELHNSLKTTFVYVTHDQAEALTMSSRMAVMIDGNLLQLDTPQEVYDNPSSLSVAQFVGSPKINIFKGTSDSSGTVSFLNVNLKRKSSESNTDLHIGIRPEHLEITNESNENTFSGTVAYRENLGSDIFFHVNIEDGSNKIIVRGLPQFTHQISNGSSVNIKRVSDKALLFNQAGMRVQFTNA
jgi:multiple sugar transport system ATP-binding protein